MTLSDIWNRTGRTDKASTHSYGHVYEWLFAPYRDLSISILEVGVSQFGGGCLDGLSEWFPKATIYGIDSDLSLCRCESNAVLKEGNAYDEVELGAMMQGINPTIIIDDAVHLIGHQRFLLNHLMPLLKDDGIYCIEDCLIEDWLPFLPSYHDLGYRHTIIDMSSPEQPDNCIIVWRKNS